MSIKTYRPVTKSLRQTSRINYREMLSGDKPTKSLLTGAKKRGGRNSQGRITVRHQGGGHKQRHRDVDFKFDKKNIPAKTTRNAVVQPPAMRNSAREGLRNAGALKTCRD